MNTIEADVDAAQSAASRVADARKRALALKDETMQITAQDDWALYKKAKHFLEEAGQIMLEAKTALDEANSRWRTVEKATNAPVQADTLAALARNAAQQAYKQANGDTNIVSQLVEEVTQNCKDACEHLC